ncbi:MAG: hypothetical protein IJT79_08800 [Ruminococcus sp.]|nr:hypothetical protein [Ruminococcus sp.]
MKKITSIVLVLLLVSFLFSVSLVSKAQGVITYHVNNPAVQTDVFEKNSDYDIPDTGEEYIFKGWYDGADESAQPVDFENVTSATDVYAHWAEIGEVTPDTSDPENSDRDKYNGFDTLGVQLKTGELSDARNGGIRFVATLSNSLLRELDALSDLTVQSGSYSDRVEYGFVAAKEKAVNDWIAFAENNGQDMSAYKLGYNGTNVNGVDTTAHNVNYQGFVSNMDCTASDYSTSSITDFDKYDDYRIYTFAVTYAAAQEMSNVNIIARAYLRYYDANGLLRTVYDDYDGTNTYGGLSVSYDTVKNSNYYSSFNKMVTDARNGTTSNADGNSLNAVCSMYISEGTAYMKLIRNAALAGNTLIDFDADLNLNGNTLNAGNYFLRSNNEFSMYNGEYSVGSAAVSFSRHFGGLTRISNVRYTGDSIAAQTQFNGLFITGENTFVSDCSFDVESGAASLYNIVLYGSGSNDAVVTGCTADIKSSGTYTAAIYSYKFNVEVNDCDLNIEETDDNSAATIYGIGAWDCDSVVLDNNDISFTGDADKVRGVYSRNNDANDTTVRYFEANNLNVDMDIDDLKYSASGDENKSNVFGLFLGQGEIGNLDGVEVNITAKAPAYAFVYNMYFAENAAVKAKGLNAVSNVTDTATINSHTSVVGYRLYGVSTSGDSNTEISSAYIKVPIGYYSNVDNNLGISAHGNSVVTINENDGDVYVQGGNAALNNFDDSKYYISGGDFCSQSHGGAYFDADAEITGGNYYVINEGAYVPSEGGMYVTADAVVNITGATITGGTNGIRAKSNLGRTDNPTVTISDTTIKAVNTGVSCSAGTIILNEGVIIKADISKSESGGTIIDNR